MTNLWMDDQKEENRFETLLYMMDAAGKTADPARLKMRLSTYWEKLDKKEKKIFTQHLITIGRIDAHVAEIINMFNGTLAQIHTLI